MWKEQESREMRDLPKRSESRRKPSKRLRPSTSLHSSMATLKRRATLVWKHLVFLEVEVSTRMLESLSRGLCQSLSPSISVRMLLYQFAMCQVTPGKASSRRKMALGWRHSETKGLLSCWASMSNLQLNRVSKAKVICKSMRRRVD